jgi:hypothetical protein
MLKHMGSSQENTTEIYIENQSVIALTKKPSVS